MYFHRINFFIALVFFFGLGCPDTPPGNGKENGECIPVTCEELGRNCGTVSDGCEEMLDCGVCSVPGESCGGGGVDGVCGTQGPSCNPLSCDQIGDYCGPMPDGCGGFVVCVECELPETCGGAGEPSRCGIAENPPPCEPLTCEDQGVGCGMAGDGCGELIDCGDCITEGETCGGGGVPSQCGAPACNPMSCADQNIECGYAGDGCGGEIDCGNCPAGTYCGVGGDPGRCGLPGCTPLTCADQGFDCGPAGDGCGGTLDCGTCTGEGETCGGGGPGVCGVAQQPPCVPQSCTDQGFNCGLAGDGCGGTIDCGTCPEGETCGGAGIPSRCGAPPCAPQTCQDQNINCGVAGDGCGGTINCGTCPEGETCGGGGVPGRCGAPPCTPVSCAQQGIECGLADNGCGVIIDCGTCTNPGETCGATTPGICGVVTAPPCTPMSCADQNIGCGLAGDGCGGTINCGSCPAGETCGGGGVPSQCGTPSCVPLTCADLGAECGRVGDGCGGMTPECGTCTAPAFCGGGGVPNQCGIDPDGVCVGLCPHQVFCPGGEATTLTGTVRAPNGVEPIYNAVVFVPMSPNIADLPAIHDGISCLRCEDQDLGEPLVSAVTASDGSFTLRHVPADIDFPLVIQVGKWRRVVTISARQPCSTTALPSAQTRLPRNRNEGHIPRIAVSTGRIDGLECVLFKSGIDASEFSHPGGNGRIHIYRANGAWPSFSLLQDCGSSCTAYQTGACPAGDCRNTMADMLYASQATLDSYDVVIFGCEASRQVRNATVRNRILNYVNNGGRLFLSHWSFDWVYNYSGATQSPPTYTTDPLHTTCDWPGGSFSGGIPSVGTCHGGNPCLTQAFVDESFERGLSFSEWLDFVGASNPQSGIVTIHEPRAHCRASQGHGRRWIYTTQAAHGGNSIQQLTFNTPVGADDDNVCGRVVYSAFHVTTGATGNAWFPNHCAGPLTAQEKILLFMMFDLAACLSDDDSLIAPCIPLSCDDMPEVECGLVGDGCGGQIDCGDCPPGETCGGAGIPHQCGSPCIPVVCGHNQCDHIADGCGGIIDCGPCPPGQVCGGDGIPNICGGGCIPLTCNDWNAECGYVADGCGDVDYCGDCPPGTFCGGDGVPNQCGGSCVPQSCGANQCGFIADGCGDTVDCGPCPPGMTCGGGGIPNQCGNNCTMNTCADWGAECGIIPDGCGGQIDCGDCPPGSYCGGDGVPHQCGTGCATLTCNDWNAECGHVPDGCGGSLDCGDCPPGSFCGGAGIPNQCGLGCPPIECEPHQCGIIGDGCGELVDCGPCPPGQVCGGGGVPNECGNPCTQITCEEMDAECGYIPDGCGDYLDCGPCPPGLFCGAGGIPNKCGIVCYPQTCEDLNAECGTLPDGCGDIIECGDCPPGMRCVRQGDAMVCIQIG